MSERGIFTSRITTFTLAAACAAVVGLASTAASAEAIASGECNDNTSVELTELKRASGVLTAKVRYTAAADGAMARVNPGETYVLDAAGAKKYEVLKDSDDNWLSSSNTSHQLYKAGDTHKAWYKFPAPPAEVASISLTLTNCEPLEDVPITDK
ncbi:MAG: hypothetical protein ACT4NU_13375 [Chromatiales bacterium]